MKAPQQTTGETDDDKVNLPTGWYRHFCLFVVFLVLVLAYADRAILGIVVEAIKHEFGLSDLQVGLLSGPAFAVFYAVLGIPLARWSDMGNRRVVITICLFIWSLMTALGGACQNFIQLFVTRIGVGVGEAGAQPSTHSLVSDYYPAHQHGKAASVLMLAAFIGALLGFALGGALLQQYNWRVALYAMGLPGLAVCVLTYFTLREPRRVTRVPRPGEIFDREARGIIGGLFTKRAFFHLLMAMAVYSFFFQGVGAFVAPFFIRSFAVSPAEIGAKFGLVYALSTLIGTILAAVLIDKLQRRNVAWLLRTPAIACVIAFPCYFTAFLAGSFDSSLLALFFASALIAIAGPAIFATLYAIVRSDQRAMGVAVLGLFANLIGLGVGPVAVGAVSDVLTATFGDQALRYTMAGFSTLAVWAALHMLIGARHIAGDYEGKRPDLMELDELAERI